jgi:hypothetical protein
MASHDPLAPLDALDTSPAPAEAGGAPRETAQPQAAENPQQANEAPPRKRGGCLVMGLVAGLLLVVIGGAAGGAVWFLTRGGDAGDGNQAAASGPVAPEPVGPPPPLEIRRAAPAAEPAASESSLAGRVERIPALVSAYEAELLAAVSAAPSDLIVAASGRQTADSEIQVPRHERWEIEFPPGNTIETYTRQLDYLKMEIGLIGGSDQIEYLVNIADPVPTVRKAPASEEKRLYLIWQRGSMREADEQLASRARVSTAGKIVAHFCPEQLETDLAQIEDAFARQNNAKRIRRTKFGIKPNAFGGFQFYVIDQKTDG